MTARAQLTTANNVEASIFFEGQEVAPVRVSHAEFWTDSGFEFAKIGLGINQQWFTENLMRSPGPHPWRFMFDGATAELDLQLVSFIADLEEGEPIHCLFSVIN